MPTPKNIDLSNSKRKEEQTFHECKLHTDLGFQETTRRATGKNRIGSISFNEADELFRSWIDENTWPYDALLFDPRIFTFIFEKTSRLISNKPRGKLIPREGSDILAARINNQLLDYQWDMATNGGSMISKWALMDINTRKYGASFALCKWRYEEDKDGKPLFDGPDMTVLNNRDCAHDLTGTAIENCNWFQVRQYVTIQDLQRVNDQSRSKPIYKNLDKLKYAVDQEKNTEKTPGSGGDSRSVNWLSRNRTIAGLETDPYGKDATFKTLEIITEYRRDRWITFAPKHGVVLRDIDNPYKNNEIPITMLRYYAIDDDLYGLSEIEPVKSLQKAINAILCQYIDEINQQLYTPIAIGPGVRQHTLDWGKGARWIMNNPMTDFRLVESRSNAAQYFNNTYSVLVASMMNALGEASLGVSNIQPFQQNKTATEVKALQLQRNARDNFNQIFLAEAIKRQLMLWHSMNQLLLFSDPKKKYYIIRVVGGDALKYFQGQRLDQSNALNQEVVNQGNKTIDSVAGGGEPPTDAELQIMSAAQQYQFPINTGSEKTPSYVPKLQMEAGNQGAKLYIEPKDILGTFDFTVDVASMAVSSDEERKQARQAAVSLLSTNPNVTMMLSAEGMKPKFKDLFVSWLEDLGFSDAERFFEKIPQQQPGAGGNPLEALLGGQGGAKPPSGVPSGVPPTGIPGGTNPNAGGETPSGNPFAGPQINTNTLAEPALQKFFGQGQ